MKYLNSFEIKNVFGGDSWGGTPEGRAPVAMPAQSDFGAACNSAAAIGGGAVGVAVTGACLAITDGVGSKACAFLGGAAATATTTTLKNVCDSIEE